ASALNKAIMCPVCPGESIDQSQNPLSVQMRAIVDEKLEQGWSEREIKDFFVERYGPSVLLEPPSEGFGITAWIVPPLAFALALASLYLTLRWMRRISDQDNENEGEDEERMEYVRRLEEATRGSGGSDESPRNREEG
ncbi:MAG: cytochrome c-type biogenesis protein CcmH, partial [Dehalococcoidia bacterium]|nr:cytochrome c-type biogenesis protein CcmH [Dehalococcoidia bacterium]